MGHYNITAQATDDHGGVTNSATVAVIVSHLPSVVLAVSQTTAAAPAVFTLNATATDSDSLVTQVRFFSGNRLLGTATQATLGSARYAFLGTSADAGVPDLRAGWQVLTNGI